MSIRKPESPVLKPEIMVSWPINFILDDEEKRKIQRRSLKIGKTVDERLNIKTKERQTEKSTLKYKLFVMMTSSSQQLNLT